MQKRIAILIVAYNAPDDLRDCLTALHELPDVMDQAEIVVVDNRCPAASDQMLMKQFPDVHLVRTHRNLGFAGGNNAGWRYIQHHLPKTDGLLLLNQDAIVTSDFLQPLIDVMEADEQVAAVQPMILLDGTDPLRVNTAGNCSHFLGFGYTLGYDKSATDPSVNIPCDLDFPSGAAVLLRTDVIERLGLFDDRMFMYMEDQDLGWKLRQAGYKVRYEPTSQVLHHYRFGSTLNSYRYLERNRIWLLKIYYHPLTLLLILPALLVMELGQFLYATANGQLRDKLWGYGQLLRPSVIAHLIRRRNQTQARRQISDKQFLAEYSGCVIFPEGEPALLRWIGNPLLNLYWTVVRSFILW